MQDSDYERREVRQFIQAYEQLYFFEKEKGLAPRFSRASHKLADFLISHELQTVVKKIEITKSPTVRESTIQQSVNDSLEEMSMSIA